MNNSEDDLISRLEALLSKPYTPPVSIPDPSNHNRKKGNVSIYVDKYRNSNGEFQQFNVRESTQYDCSNSPVSAPLSAKSSILSPPDPKQRLSISTAAFGKESILESDEEDSPKVYSLQPLEKKANFEDFAQMKIENFDSKVFKNKVNVVNQDSIIKTTKNNPFKVHPDLIKAFPQEKATKFNPFIKQKDTDLSLQSKGLSCKSTKTESSLNPADAFIRDEVEGDLIKKGNNNVIDNWIDELDDTQSPVTSTKIRTKSRRSRRNYLSTRSKPTFLKKMHRKQHYFDNEEENPENVYNTASSFNLINAKVSRRDKEWRQSYLEKRNQINKITIPPRDSSLKNTVQILEGKNISQARSKIGLYKPSSISKAKARNLIKFSDETKLHTSSQVSRINFKRDPFNVKITYVIDADLENKNEQAEEYNDKKTEPQNRCALPHFRSLLRKPKPIRVKKRSMKLILPLRI